MQNDPRVDPVLSNADWASIAQRLVKSVGLSECRWVAVRHDDHGIHIAATLVDENGHRPHLSYEKRKLNQCRVSLETQYCKRHTDPGTRTGGVSYQRHEVEKARREGATRPAKIRLRNAIERACIATDNPDDFERELADQGVNVGFRHSTINPHEVTGYKVALDGHVTAAGDLIWYKASDIDRALTWPKIQARWQCPRVDDPDRTDSAIINDYTARARVAADRLRRSPTAADELQGGISDLAKALANSRPRSTDNLTDWDKFLDQTHWTGRTPGGTGTRSHQRSSAGLTAAAHCLMVTLRGQAAPDMWGLIAVQVAETLRVLAYAHQHENRVRQADQAASASVGLTAAAVASETNSTRTCDHRIPTHDGTPITQLKSAPRNTR